jgi:hypothetical protein
MTSLRITHYKSKATAHACSVCKGTNKASKYGEVKDCWNCDGQGLVHDAVTQARRDQRFAIELSQVRSIVRSTSCSHSINDTVCAFLAEIEDHVKSVRLGVAREVIWNGNVFGEEQESIDVTRVVFTAHGHDFDAIVADYIANS